MQIAPPDLAHNIAYCRDMIILQECGSLKGIYVPRGTTGVCSMQIFGASVHASILMLRVYNSALKYYQQEVVEDNIYDRWFKVNVIHDTGAHKIKVFIDEALKLIVSDGGRSLHYFKFGVYTQEGSSNYMESRWKGIKVLKLAD